MLQGLPYGQEIDWWALGIIVYAMMFGMFPFSDPDEYRLQEKICFGDVKYPMDISEEAEMIMSGVSIINIKTEALHVLQQGYHMLSFSLDTSPC
jgi:serine/threonine protein kinase